MESLLKLQMRLVPDIVKVMKRRLHILKAIDTLGPIGRRSLATELDESERTIRTEVDFLKQENLVKVAKTGIKISEDGLNTLLQLEGVLSVIREKSAEEEQLKKQLGIENVIIVPGDADESRFVKKELGHFGAKALMSLVKKDDIIAVTGGTTMVAVAEKLTSEIANKKITFVPARGAIGQDVKNEANTVCAKMAEVTESSYYSLYIPDEVSPAMYDTVIKEKEIKETLQLIHSSSIIMHGIGDAILMAEKRKSSPENLEKIVEGKAKGEALGHYFNEDGKVVHKVKTIGIQAEHLKRARTIIAVAGGSSKSEAVKAYLKQSLPTTVLITDEAVAKELLKNNLNNKN